MSAVFVTGGAGFIGSHLVDRLLAKGEQVTVLDNFNSFYDPAIKRENIAEHLQNDHYTLVEGDIRDRNLVSGLFQKNRFDTVIHLAAMAGVRPSLADPRLYADVNVQGTTNILEAMRENDVSRMLYASSSSVYGNNHKVPFSESDPVEEPVSPYAATKRATELICYSYHHLFQMQIACLRFFTVYGPRQRPEMAIHLFADRISHGDPIDIYAQGQSCRDYTYIDDIVDGVIACHRAKFGYEIINLGRSDTVLLNDLVDKIENALGRPAERRYVPGQPGDVDQTYADISKAQRLFGFEPKVSIDTGLQQFVKWYRRKRG